MAWTTPRTWVSLELVTASLMNVHVRDNLLALRALLSNQCVAYQAAGQTVSAGNTTALTLTSEVVDTAEMHSTSVNTNQIVVPTAGWYLILGHAAVSGNNNGTASLHLRVGGAALTPPVYDSFVTAATDFEDHVMHVWAYVNLSASAVVDMAGQAATNDFTFSDKKLTVIGPLPAP